MNFHRRKNLRRLGVGILLIIAGAVVIGNHGADDTHTLAVNAPHDVSFKMAENSIDDLVQTEAGDSFQKTSVESSVTKADPSAARSSKNPGNTFSRLRLIRQCERSFGANCVGLSEKRVRQMADTSAGLMEALADQTATELGRLNRQARTEMERGMPLSFSLAQVAAAYVNHPDDIVREKALELATLIVTSEPRTALAIASKAVELTVSGPLTKQALKILEATYGSDPGAVDRTLVKALDQGGWEVRDRVAEGLLPFLTSDNRDIYERELAKAPVRSKQALYLRLSLEEFDRMKRL